MQRYTRAGGNEWGTTVDHNLMPQATKGPNKTNEVCTNASMTLTEKSRIDGDSQSRLEMTLRTA